MTHRACSHTEAPRIFLSSNNANEKLFLRLDEAYWRYCTMVLAPCQAENVSGVINKQVLQIFQEFVVWFRHPSNFRLVVWRCPGKWSTVHSTFTQSVRQLSLFLLEACASLLEDFLLQLKFCQELFDGPRVHGA